MTLFSLRIWRTLIHLLNLKCLWDTKAADPPIFIYTQSTPTEQQNRLVLLCRLYGAVDKLLSKVGLMFNKIVITVHPPIKMLSFLNGFVFIQLFIFVLISFCWINLLFQQQSTRWQHLYWSYNAAFLRRSSLKLRRHLTLHALNNKSDFFNWLD